MLERSNSKFMKKNAKEQSIQQITDKEILSLYHQGYSANIISQKYSLNPARISKVLRASGLGPRDYRTMPDFIKRVLRELILAGFTYSEISRKTNISYNYIREYVRRSEEMKERSLELFYRKTNNSTPPSIPPHSVCSEHMIAEFRHNFINGAAGFCYLVMNMNANEEQMIYLFSIISDEMLREHEEHLKMYILSEYNAGIPIIGISKKIGVSPTYVSNAVKSGH